PAMSKTVEVWLLAPLRPKDRVCVAAFAWPKPAVRDKTQAIRMLRMCRILQSPCKQSPIEGACRVVSQRSGCALLPQKTPGIGSRNYFRHRLAPKRLVVEIALEEGRIDALLLSREAALKAASAASNVSASPVGGLPS